MRNRGEFSKRGCQLGGFGGWVGVCEEHEKCSSALREIGEMGWMAKETMTAQISF